MKMNMEQMVILNRVSSDVNEIEHCLINHDWLWLCQNDSEHSKIGPDLVWMIVTNWNEPWWHMIGSDWK